MRNPSKQYAMAYAVLFSFIIQSVSFQGTAMAIQMADDSNTGIMPVAISTTQPVTLVENKNAAVQLAATPIPAASPVNFKLVNFFNNGIYGDGDDQSITIVNDKATFTTYRRVMTATYDHSTDTVTFVGPDLMQGANPNSKYEFKFKFKNNAGKLEILEHSVTAKIVGKPAWSIKTLKYYSDGKISDSISWQTNANAPTQMSASDISASLHFDYDSRGGIVTKISTYNSAFAADASLPNGGSMSNKISEFFTYTYGDATIPSTTPTTHITITDFDASSSLQPIGVVSKYSVNAGYYDWNNNRSYGYNGYVEKSDVLPSDLAALSTITDASAASIDLIKSLSMTYMKVEGFWPNLKQNWWNTVKYGVTSYKSDGLFVPKFVDYYTVPGGDNFYIYVVTPAGINDLGNPSKQMAIERNSVYVHTLTVGGKNYQFNASVGGDLFRPDKTAIVRLVFNSEEYDNVKQRYVEQVFVDYPSNKQVTLNGILCDITFDVTGKVILTPVVIMPAAPKPVAPVASVPLPVVVTPAPAPAPAPVAPKPVASAPAPVASTPAPAPAAKALAAPVASTPAPVVVTPVASIPVAPVASAPVAPKPVASVSSAVAATAQAPGTLTTSTPTSRSVAVTRTPVSSTPAPVASTPAPVVVAPVASIPVAPVASAPVASAPVAPKPVAAVSTTIPSATPVNFTNTKPLIDESHTDKLSIVNDVAIYTDSLGKAYRGIYDHATNSVTIVAVAPVTPSIAGYQWVYKFSFSTTGSNAVLTEFSTTKRLSGKTAFSVDTYIYYPNGSVSDIRFQWTNANAVGHRSTSVSDSSIHFDYDASGRVIAKIGNSDYTNEPTATMPQGGQVKQMTKNLYSYDAQGRMLSRLTLIDNYFYDANMQAAGYKPTCTALAEFWTYGANGTSTLTMIQCSYAQSAGNEADRTALLAATSAGNMTVASVEALSTAKSRTVYNLDGGAIAVKSVTYAKDATGTFVPKKIDQRAPDGKGSISYLVNPAFASDLNDLSKHTAVLSSQVVMINGVSYYAMSYIEPGTWTIYYSFISIMGLPGGSSDSVSKKLTVGGVVYDIIHANDGKITLVKTVTLASVTPAVAPTLPATPVNYTNTQVSEASTNDERITIVNNQLTYVGDNLGTLTGVFNPTDNTVTIVTADKSRMSQYPNAKVTLKFSFVKNADGSVNLKEFTKTFKLSDSALAHQIVVSKYNSSKKLVSLATTFFAGSAYETKVTELFSYDAQNRKEKKLTIQTFPGSQKFSILAEFLDYSSNTITQLSGEGANVPGHEADLSALAALVSSDDVTAASLEAMNSVSSKGVVNVQSLTSGYQPLKQIEYNRDTDGVMRAKLIIIVNSNVETSYLVDPAFANDLNDLSKHTKFNLTPQNVTVGGVTYQCRAYIDKSTWTMKYYFIGPMFSSYTQANGNQVTLGGILYNIVHAKDGTVTLVKA